MMSPLEDSELQVDYGNEAVVRPAKKTLEYGSKVVDQGVLIAQSPQRKKQK